MNRINQTIKKNQKKTKSDQKEIPTFGVDGNVIIPGKKERQKKIKKVIIIASAVALFIYIPQFFMKGTSSSEKNKLAVSLDVSAVKRSTDAMKENSAADFDSDGIDNGEEQNQNTNCWFLDSDQDGLTDYCEIYITKTNPNKADIGYLIDKQKTEDEKKGKKVSSPCTSTKSSFNVIKTFYYDFIYNKRICFFDQKDYPFAPFLLFACITYVFWKRGCL